MSVYDFVTPTRNNIWQASGCFLEPLGSYLKALGLLKLLGDEATGGWKEGKFFLQTIQTPEEVLNFLVHEVSFSPIVTPWNGTNGLWKADAGSKLISQIGNSPRLAELKGVLGEAKDIIEQYPSDKQPSRKDKAAFIETCLGRIKNEAWRLWANACVTVVADDKGKEDFAFSYLLGTGGNIGARDLGANYLQALSYLVDLPTGEPTDSSTTFWHTAIFGGNLKNSVLPEALGAQFFPSSDYILDAKHFPYGASGGTSTAVANPADVVLMTEGLLTFSILAKRKLESDEQGIAEYSLAVDLCSGTAETAVSGEYRGNIEEFWLPIWTEPQSFDELRKLLFAALRGRLPRTGRPDSLDFAENIVRHAKEFNILEFQRVGFFTRKGQSNFAIPLGIFQVSEAGDLGPELTSYRKRIASLAKGRAATNTLIGLSRKLESYLFDLASGHGAVLPVIKTLGQLELYFARSPSYQQQINPVKELSPDWIEKSLEESPCPVTRLAISLASLWLRNRISPAMPGSKGWFWSDSTVSWGPDLVTNLIKLQRYWATEEKPSYPKMTISPTFADIAELINGLVDLKELEVMAAGFSLCKTPQPSFEGTAKNQILLPGLFQLSSFCLWSDFGAMSIVNALATGDLAKARDLCNQKLLTHKLSTFPVPLPSQKPQLMAAAMVFPLAPSQLKAIKTYFLE